MYGLLALYIILNFILPVVVYVPLRSSVPFLYIFAVVDSKVTLITSPSVTVDCVSNDAICVVEELYPCTANRPLELTTSNSTS